MIDKFDEIVQNVFSKDYDFVCLSETWLKSADCTEYNVHHYHCINKPRSFRHKRAKRGAGGILLYINNRIWRNVVLLNNTTADDRLWIKFGTHLQVITISTFVFATCTLEIQVLCIMINQDGHISSLKLLICQQEVTFFFVEISMLGLGINMTMLTVMLKSLLIPIYLMLLIKGPSECLQMQQ